MPHSCLCFVEREREMGVGNLKQWANIAKEALDQTVLVAKFFCGLHITNTYLCTTAMVYGPSMLPTFNLIGDLVLAERISTRFGKVGAGDVVLIRSPENPRKIVTKRVTAMEGDSVSYVLDPNFGDRCETVVVPKGHIWVEGDNSYASRDSRIFGAVPYGLLQGRVFWRIWPPDAFGSVAHRLE
ncbi:mitochondrial ATP-independent inner membrane protease subunit 1a-like [Cornus florida]|uniref:mitochondrial ATP-independent inner membrane protease subunit 1a-like n=1 Tax=Cornus florida TaxID=4283 RepID=UPI0028968B71|nr:mitochondrial ATP-independent inner membrane protease subunit 1a-like [Cornus florida]